MKLTDPGWKSLTGGYRVPYDPRPALGNLAAGAEMSESWGELWTELYHQGDVGDASYATVCALVDIFCSGRHPNANLFFLAATIELARHHNNPPLPEWLRENYEEAWRKLAELALKMLHEDIDSDTFRSVLSVLAIARGELKLAAIILHLDNSMLDEIGEQYLGWELHNESPSDPHTSA